MERGELCFLFPGWWWGGGGGGHNTVNSKIFMRVLFSGNAKFHENKTLAKSLSFTDIGKSCHNL